MAETTKMKISLETAQLIYNAYSEGFSDGASTFGGYTSDTINAHDYAEAMKDMFDFDGDIVLDYEDEDEDGDEDEE